MAKCTTCHKKAPPKKKQCWSCLKRAYAARHPMRYSFYVLKNNAKRRQVVFGLTFEDFKKFAGKTDYMNGKGITSEAYHIDRIDERKGYFKNNIQMLTNSQNIKKYIKFDFEQKQMGGSGFKTAVFNKKTGTDDEDYPF